MPTHEFDDKTMPSPEQFAHLLQSDDAQYDPVEELLSLERELAEFEQRYSVEHQETISSAEFYKRYHAGQMGDAIEFIRWAGRYKLYQRLKRGLQNQSATC